MFQKLSTIGALCCGLMLLSACHNNYPAVLPELADGLDKNAVFKAHDDYPEDCSQVELPIVKSDCALVFIGGFQDQEHGVLRRCYDAAPAIQDKPAPYKEVRAYYHWEGDEGNLLRHSTKSISDDIAAWCKLNPTSTLVIIGHSYGGSSSMEVARSIPEEFKGTFALATLDPVSRRKSTKPRERAPRVDFWVNSYVKNRRAMHELLIIAGGPWNECPEADRNLVFCGKDLDFTGSYHHAHNNARALLVEKEATSHTAVWTILQDFLKSK